MRTEIRSSENEPKLKVVETGNNRAQIELEIDRHIRSLAALIQKLHPSDRRQYYSGLLAHLMNQPVDTAAMKKHSAITDTDLSCLPTENLILIRELSQKLNELYCITGDIE